MESSKVPSLPIHSFPSITPETAHQLAVMVTSGMPTREAIRYFLPEGISEGLAAKQHEAWIGSKEYARAVQRLQGKPWQEMSLEERIQHSIDKHYSELAYFLYSRNYAELTGHERAKADTCRQVLEAKLAGLSGQQDGLTRWWADVQAGRAKLPGLAA